MKDNIQAWAEANAPKVLGVDKSQLMTTQLFTINDENDEKIVKEILGIFNHKTAIAVINSYRDEVYGKAHKHVINMCFSLASVNVHRRNYHAKYPDARKKADAKMKSWGATVETAIYSQDLLVEVVGALINFKSALDSLAQCLGVVYGFNIKSWGSNGDKVIKALDRNVPKDKKLSKQQLEDFIRSHQDVTKDFIELRDNLGHGLTEYRETISGFFKRHIDKEIQNPRTNLGPQVVDCGDLVDSCAKLSNDYCREVIALLLSSLAPGFKVGNLNGKYVWAHEDLKL